MTMLYVDLDTLPGEDSDGEWEGRSFYCGRCMAKYAQQEHKEDYQDPPCKTHSRQYPSQ